MCLITKNKRVQTAKEDIIVYKILNPDLTTIFFKFKYEIGKLYETKMTRLPINSKKWKAYSITDSDWCNHNFPYWRIGVRGVGRTHSVRKGMMCIANGFHSATTIERNGFSRFHVTAECVIPKGAKYHTDETGLVVSNKLIITKTL